MAPTDPIPANLAAAFHEAVGLYSDWNPAFPELKVTIERVPFDMGAVCGFVNKFDDPLPEAAFDRLLTYMHAEHAALKEKLTSDRSYSAAAFCLRKLIESKKADQQRIEELRRQR
jgi:hypothetical protein